MRKEDSEGVCGLPVRWQDGAASAAAQGASALAELPVLQREQCLLLPGEPPQDVSKCPAKHM